MLNYSAHIIRFFALLILQTVILNNLNIHGSVNPYIYPLFLLLLPITIPHGVLLLPRFPETLEISRSRFFC